MLLPYRIPPNSHKRRQKISNDNSKSEHDLKRPQISSNDLKTTQKNGIVEPESNADSAVNLTIIRRNKMRGGANFEINDNYSDGKLHKKNL